MKIVHVVVTESFAGTERYVSEVASRQSRLGHDVAVVGGAPLSMRSRMPLPVRHFAGGSMSQALTALRVLGKQDIVHAHLGLAERTAMRAVAFNRARLVATQHLHRSLPGGFRARLGDVLNDRLFALRIAVSQSIASEYEPKLPILLNGVASVEVPAKPRHGEGRYVLLAQRLDADKDTSTGLHGWAISGLAEEGWRLRVAGSGVEHGSLKELARRLRVAESVDFLGWREDVFELMLTSQIFLATAPEEPLGLSVLEAMARSLPVVATAGGGHLETVGRCPEARLFAANDPEACAAALRELAESGERRAAYGAALRELQRSQFDVENHVNRLLQMYVDPGSVSRRHL